VVCVWYPTARAVLLWNLTEKREELDLRYRGSRRTMNVDGFGHGADRRYRRTMTNACRFVDTKPGGNHSSWG